MIAGSRHSDARQVAEVASERACALIETPDQATTYEETKSVITEQNMNEAANDCTSGQEPRIIAIVHTFSIGNKFLP